jgi:hypothetical protein
METVVTSSAASEPLSSGALRTPAPLPRVAPERRRRFDSILEAAAREGLPHVPAGGSR